MESRARNLYVISGVIIVYLVAGADLDQLTLLGIRSPAHYPIVFSGASVVALIWFWWRYRLSWKGGSIGQAFRNNYLRDLHATKPFQDWVENRVDHVPILASYTNYRNHDFSKARFVSYAEEASPTGESRSKIRVDGLVYNDSQSNHSLGKKFFPGKTTFAISVPWQLHYRHSPRFYLSQAINEEAFAAQRLPLVAFGVAVVLIACKLIAWKWPGWDPAGFWGLLTAPSPAAPCDAEKVLIHS